MIYIIAMQLGLMADELDADFFGASTTNQITANPLDNFDTDIMMLNPFFVGPDTKGIRGEGIREMTIRQVDRVLILCCLSHEGLPLCRKLFDQVVEKTVFESLSNVVTLVSTTIQLLQTETHQNQTVKVGSEFLQRFNHQNLVLNTHELVIPILNMTCADTLIYTSLYESRYDINHLLKLKALSKYFNCDSYTGIVQQRLSEITTNMRESEYWLTFDNCYLNETEEFQNREFQNRQFKYVSPKVDSVSTSTISKETIVEIFKATQNEKELYDLFNTLLLSYNLCHLVINNDKVLDIMHPIITKYAALYRYIMGYSWLTLYKEEKSANRDSRVIFDIDTANKLPFFAYCEDDLHLNPYISVLADTESLNSTLNYLGISQINGYREYGIDTLDGFKKKFNIFTSKTHNKSIFDGLETDSSGRWASFVVCGSVIPACAEKRSPLIDTVTTNDMNFDARWNRFFGEYYRECNINMMCNKQSVFSFMDEVSNLAKVINTNINATVNIEPTKVCTVTINKNCISNCFSAVNSDYIINNINTNQIKEMFYAKYVSTKIEKNVEQRNIHDSSTNSLYESFFKLCSIDDLTICVVDKIDNTIISDNDTYLSDGNNIPMLKVSEDILFNLTSPQLAHSIKLVKTDDEDYVVSISNFHLPCVRGYYDNVTVHLLPSCITALMTHINIDCSFTSDPYDTLNKYRMRGFGTILNKEEKERLAAYNVTAAPEFSEESQHILGTIDMDKKLFKPGKLIGVPDDCYRTVQHTYLDSFEELCMYYKNVTDDVDLIKYKAISINGDVVPFKRWILEAAYQEIY
jgi:hypothetical protein